MMKCSCGDSTGSEHPASTPGTTTCTTNTPSESIKGMSSGVSGAAGNRKGLYYPWASISRSAFAALGEGRGPSGNGGLTKEVVSLPIFPELTEGQVTEVGEASGSSTPGEPISGLPETSASSICRRSFLG